MIHRLVAECRKVLIRKLMKVSEGEEESEKLSKISWDRLRDDLSRESLEHSFVKNKRNA